MWAGRKVEKFVITFEKLYNIFLPNEGFCEPRGRSETRRITVPQRGSICGEMPEVEQHFYRRLTFLFPYYYYSNYVFDRPLVVNSINRNRLKMKIQPEILFPFRDSIDSVHF